MSAYKYLNKNENVGLVTDDFLWMKICFLTHMCFKTTQACVWKAEAELQDPACKFYMSAEL